MWGSLWLSHYTIFLVSWALVIHVQTLHHNKQYFNIWHNTRITQYTQKIYLYELKSYIGQPTTKYYEAWLCLKYTVKHAHVIRTGLKWIHAYNVFPDRDFITEFAVNSIQLFHCSLRKIPSGGKYNVSGIPGNRGTNVLVYFPRSNKMTAMLHFHSWKYLKNRSEILGVTSADSWDVMSNVAGTVKCPSLVQSGVLSIPKFFTRQYNVCSARSERAI